MKDKKRKKKNGVALEREERCERRVAGDKR